MQSSSRVKSYSLPLLLPNHSSPLLLPNHSNPKYRRRTKRGKTFLELAQMSANHRFQLLTPSELGPQLLRPCKDNRQEMRGGRTLFPSETRTCFLRVKAVIASLPLPIIPLSSTGTTEIGTTGTIGTTGIIGIAETAGTVGDKETTGNLHQIQQMSSCQTSQLRPLPSSKPQGRTRTQTHRTVVTIGKAKRIANPSLV